MCDPLTIAGIAATAGGAALNYSAQNKVNAARDSVMAAERTRQQGYNAEASTINNQSRDRYAGFQGQEDAQAKTLGDLFKAPAAASPGVPTAAIPTSGSNITVNEEAKKSGQAKAYTDSQAERLGELRSFGDVLGGISRDQARDTGYIGQIAGFKRGSSNVVPYELESANHTADGTKFLGDILSGGGRVATSAGLSGGSLFGGAAKVGAPSNVLSSAAAFPAKAAPVTMLAGASPFRWY